MLRAELDGLPIQEMSELPYRSLAAIARLLSEIYVLGRGGALDEDFSMVTVTHARLGEPAFGISPGHAELWLTLRTLTDPKMDALRLQAESLVRSVAASGGLRAEITYRDAFNHCGLKNGWSFIGCAFAVRMRAWTA